MVLSIQPAASAAQGNRSEGHLQNVGDLGTITTSPIQTENQSDFYTDPHEDVPILAEKEELRESNIKHFIREDMSMEAVLYPTSVHYEKDGVWTDIDNRLVAVKEDGRTVYRNREAGYIVTFASDAKDNEWVKLEKSGASVSWKLSGSDMTRAKTSSPEVMNPRSLIQDKRVLSNLASQITYPDVFTGVDVTYTIDPSGVREYIVIESAARAASAYTFDVTVDGVTPAVTDNVITLSADGEEIFQISAPLVTDSAGNICEDVALQLVPVSSGADVMSEGKITEETAVSDALAALGTENVDQISALKLSEEESFTFSYRMIPDEEWMNDPERVWPVIVDPDVIVGPSQIIDTFVCSNKTGYVLSDAAYTQLGMIVTQVLVVLIIN